MPLGPYASLLRELREEYENFRKLAEAEHIRKGSPSGRFPTLEQTTAALAAESRNSAAATAATAATAAPRNSAAATAVAPSGPPKKPTWATVAAATTRKH